MLNPLRIPLTSFWGIMWWITLICILIQLLLWSKAERDLKNSDTIYKASKLIGLQKIILGIQLTLVISTCITLFHVRSTGLFLFKSVTLAAFSYLSYTNIKFLRQNRKPEDVVALHFARIHHKEHEAKNYKAAAEAAQKAFEYGCNWIPTWITTARFYKEYGFSCEEAKDFLEHANKMINSDKRDDKIQAYYEDTAGVIAIRECQLKDAIEHFKNAQIYNFANHRENLIKKLESDLYGTEWKPDQNVND